MAQKIAVLRANALGDFIFTLPALHALRRAMPDAEIVYLGKAWHKAYLTNRPGPIDRVEVLPPYPGVGEKDTYVADEAEVEAFFVRMQQEQFDIAIQMHGGGFYSNPFTKRLGAKLTIGLKTPDATPLDVNVSYVGVYSEILRFLEVVSHLGAVATSIAPSIAVTASDLDEVYNVLVHPKDQHFVVIHPGASDPRRRWPAENFAEIADFLVDQGYHVYLTGTAFERSVIEDVLNRVANQERITNLCDKLSLGGMTGLLSLADLMVSNDTGPLHLARALETPSVGIFWTVNCLTAVWPNSNFHRSLIAWDPYCPLCGTDCVQPNFEHEHCDHETSFTAYIKVEEVKKALQNLLVLTETKSAV